MWQQEETQDGGVGNLVVKGFTVKVEEGRVDADVVSVGEMLCYLKADFHA